MPRLSTPSQTPARFWPLRATRHALKLVAIAALASCGGSMSPDASMQVEEDRAAALDTALVDYGPGPGIAYDEAAEDARQSALGNVKAQAIAVPVGPADAHLKGHFGASFSWPIIPLHTVLLPDGRVLSFGSNPNGAQNGLMYYALWDPELGMGSKSKLLLDNTTGTDIFCAGQALMPQGDVLLVGGDRIVNGSRNYANRDVNIFTPGNNALTKQAGSMAFQRWYATVVTSASGELVVMGGRDDRYFEGNATYPPTADTFAPAPEVYTPGVGWRLLNTASSDHAYGSVAQSWNYPRAWWGPDGRVIIITPVGKIFALDVAGTGSFVQLSTGQVPAGAYNLPAVMYQPGKILAVRKLGAAALVDINGPAPVVSATQPLSGDRQFGNATVLPDGKVWVNGGSSTANTLEGAYYHSEMWDPATGQWSTTATAAKARLYHSISMLMPDGSVLTGAGGAPGPVKQLNAEIYFPPYLYKTDGSGQPAVRPVISTAPTAATWGQDIAVTMKSTGTVARMTLVRFGAVTHAFHSDQRFQDVPFSQSGKNLTVTLPALAHTAPPGFYMLFALDANGVPSKAKVLRLGA